MAQTGSNNGCFNAYLEWLVLCDISPVWLTVGEVNHLNTGELCYLDPANMPHTLGWQVWMTWRSTGVSSSQTSTLPSSYILQEPIECGDHRTPNYHGSPGCLDRECVVAMADLLRPSGTSHKRGRWSLMSSLLEAIQPQLLHSTNKNNIIESLFFVKHVYVSVNIWYR